MYVMCVCVFLSILFLLLFVGMHVCMCACLHRCVYKCMCVGVCMHVSMYLCFRVSVYLCILAFLDDDAAIVISIRRACGMCHGRGGRVRAHHYSPRLARKAEASAFACWTSASSPTAFQCFHLVFPSSSVYFTLHAFLDSTQWTPALEEAP